MENWNARLAKAMTAKDKNMSDVARHLGIEPSAVRTWVSDKKEVQAADIRSSNLLAVCEYLDCDPYVIMYGKKRESDVPAASQAAKNLDESNMLLLKNIKLLVTHQILAELPDSTKDFLYALLGADDLGKELAKITLSMHKIDDFNYDKLVKLLVK